MFVVVVVVFFSEAFQEFLYKLYILILSIVKNLISVFK